MCHFCSTLVCFHPIHINHLAKISLINMTLKWHYINMFEKIHNFWLVRHGFWLVWLWSHPISHYYILKIFQNLELQVYKKIKEPSNFWYEFFFSQMLGAWCMENVSFEVFKMYILCVLKVNHIKLVLRLKWNSKALNDSLNTSLE
jgi:hypothetical protein